MSDRQAFRLQARQVAVTDPIWDPCYCAVREEHAINDALFAPLSNYRGSQQAGRHIKQNGIANQSWLGECSPRA